MTSCYANDELLWDYLHDLLDPAQVNQLEEHLATCAACRQALEIAKADCANLAAAARLDGPFPLFEAPAEEMPATLPLRSGWASATKRWTWAAAAVLLIAFGLPFAGYQVGSVQPSARFAASRKRRAGEARATRTLARSVCCRSERCH